MSPLLQQVLREIAQLAPEERSQLIEHIHQMQNSSETVTSPKTPESASKETSSSSDPLIGLFAGSPDLATRSEDILHQDLTAQGWTWKQPSQ
jgi:hypothetical protein